MESIGKLTIYIGAACNVVDGIAIYRSVRVQTKDYITHVEAVAYVAYHRKTVPNCNQYSYIWQQEAAEL